MRTGTFNNSGSPASGSVTTNDNTFISSQPSTDYLNQTNLVAFQSVDGTYQCGLGYYYAAADSDMGMPEQTFNYVSTNFNGWSSITSTSGLSAFCFLAGTLISTSTGDISVESLGTGDQVVTFDGGIQQIFWVGRKTMATAFTSEKDLPVLITAGSLGSGLPKRDLKVMPAHAFLIEDVLVVAGKLVNGTTIRRMTRDEIGSHFTYYAVETQDHCLLLAEGAAAETKGNIKGNERAFDNWQEYVSLYGPEGRSYPVMPLKRYRMVDDLPTHILQITQGIGSTKCAA